MNFTKALGMEPKTSSNSGFKINIEDFVNSAGEMNLPRIPPPPPLEDDHPEADLVLQWIELTEHNRRIAAKHLPYPEIDPLVEMTAKAMGQMIKTPDMVAPYVFWVRKYPEGIHSIAEFNWFMEGSDYLPIPALPSVPRGRKMFANYDAENALPLAQVMNEIMTVKHIGSVPPNVADFARYATPGPHEISHEMWHTFRQFIGMPT